MCNDAVSGAHHPPRHGFNTAWWEMSPTVSGKYILFGRQSLPNYARQQVILGNRATGAQLKLANFVSTDSSASAYPGQVNGNWAVWTICGNGRCSVYRRDIAAGVTKKLINTSTTAYFQKQRLRIQRRHRLLRAIRCRLNGADLVKHPLGKPATVVAHVAPGLDHKHICHRSLGWRHRCLLQRADCNGTKSAVLKLIDS